MDSIFKRYNVIFVSFFVLVLTITGLYFAIPNFAGRTITDLTTDSKIEIDSSGNFFIVLDGEKISADRPVFIAIIDGNRKVLASKTLSFGELMDLGKSAANAKDGFYSGSGKYSFSLEKVLSYEIPKGDYELDFTMFNPDFIIRKKFSVE